ncbi:MAG: hypothetical protein EZS28_034577, partial [Streblomastix strix]
SEEDEHMNTVKLADSIRKIKPKKAEIELKTSEKRLSELEGASERLRRHVETVANQLVNHQENVKEGFCGEQKSKNELKKFAKEKQRALNGNRTDRINPLDAEQENTQNQNLNLNSSSRSSTQARDYNPKSIDEEDEDPNQFIVNGVDLQATNIDGVLAAVGRSYERDELKQEEAAQTLGSTDSMDRVKRNAIERYEKAKKELDEKASECFNQCHLIVDQVHRRNDEFRDQERMKKKKEKEKELIKEKMLQAAKNAALTVVNQGIYSAQNNMIKQASTVNTVNSALKKPKSALVRYDASTNGITGDKNRTGKQEQQPNVLQATPDQQGRNINMQSSIKSKKSITTSRGSNRRFQQGDGTGFNQEDQEEEEYMQSGEVDLMNKQLQVLEQTAEETAEENENLVREKYKKVKRDIDLRWFSFLAAYDENRRDVLYLEQLNKIFVTHASMLRNYLTKQTQENDRTKQLLQELKLLVDELSEGNNLNQKNLSPDKSVGGKDWQKQSTSNNQKDIKNGNNQQTNRSAIVPISKTNSSSSQTSQKLQQQQQQQHQLQQQQQHNKHKRILKLLCEIIRLHHRRSSVLGSIVITPTILIPPGCVQRGNILKEKQKEKEKLIFGSENGDDSDEQDDQNESDQNQSQNQQKGAKDGKNGQLNTPQNVGKGGKQVQNDPKTNKTGLSDQKGSKTGTGVNASSSSSGAKGAKGAQITATTGKDDQLSIEQYQNLKLKQLTFKLFEDECSLAVMVEDEEDKKKRMRRILLMRQKNHQKRGSNKKDNNNTDLDQPEGEDIETFMSTLPQFPKINSFMIFLGEESSVFKTVARQNLIGLQIEQGLIDGQDDNKERNDDNTDLDKRDVSVITAEVPGD